jgi:hypothetical protein
VQVKVKNDAGQVEFMDDVDPDDVEQLKSELPSGWYIDD